MCIVLAFVLAEANVLDVIRYLRGSKTFRPSDRWGPLLEEAYNACCRASSVM